jgi:hypothetical protein
MQSLASRASWRSLGACQGGDGVGVGGLLLANAAEASALPDLRTTFNVLDGAASAQKTACDPTSLLLTWEDTWRCLLHGGRIMDGGDGSSCGNGGIGTECWGLYNCLDRYSRYLRTFE